MQCNTLVLKVASRCNLNCTYCYVYNLGDLTYKDQPKFMEQDIVEAVLQKVASHCRKYKMRNFYFVFHGGEPLLQTIVFFEEFINRAHCLVGSGTRLHFAVQTNGVLLNKEWCDFFVKHAVTIGISLDGYKEAHDSQRVDHQGKGSYDQVIAAIDLVNSYKGKLGLGILNVINVATDPVKIYQQIKRLNIRHFNLLLPYASWDAPPTGWISEDSTVYADWLIRVFDAWYADEQPKPSIPIFEQILGLSIGIKQRSQYFGGEYLDFFIIETDGSIEVSGALKICGSGMTKQNLNIKEIDIDEALENQQLMMQYFSHRDLPYPCDSCKLSAICGGGFLPNRYNSKNGFNNRSVYCHDSLKLICHIQNTLMDGLGDLLLTESDLLSYAAIKQEIYHLININNPYETEV